MKTIEREIKSVGVRTGDPLTPDAVVTLSAAQLRTEMSEHVARPDELHGSTYRIKALDNSAFYITINDILLDEGTEHARLQPYEMFVNSKDSSSKSWITTVCLLVSAVMRKGGDITFLIDEFKAIRDPDGGYWADQKMMPSLQAHIGHVLEKHFKKRGLLPTETENLAAIIEGVKDYLHKNDGVIGSQCPTCKEMSVVIEEGCATCKWCGYSKCG